MEHNKPDTNRSSKGFRGKSRETKGKVKLSKYFEKRKKQPNFFLSVFVTTLRLFLVFFIILGFAGFGGVLGIAQAYLDSAPTLDINQIENQSETSFIYDQNGNLITKYFGLENRVWAKLEEIPQTLQDAFIAIEDVRFYAHNGVDFKRLFGAVINNLRNESIQGGSTITQQLIKNRILTPEQTYKRKIQEMYLAFELEKKYNKEQILEAYLNTIHLGGANYGVKAAAKDYFNKELKDLTLRECAVLAGITKNPSLYDPRLNLYVRNKPEITYKRTNLVLRAMYENNFISKEEYEAAKFDLTGENPEQNELFVQETSTSNDYPMKYFIEYVIYEVREKLMLQNGWQGDEGRKKAEALIMAGGLHIYTTMDPEIQKTVEEAVYNYNNLPKFANEKYNKSASGLSQPQAAAVVIDHHTGQLKAIVGGKQPPTVKRGFNRAFMSELALGSAIKPLAVYGPFIERGYPGGIIFENIPLPIEGWISEKGYPENFEGGGYTGPTDVRTAITKSLNVVAARIILERIGPEYAASKLKDLGFDPKHVTTNPSDLALGTHGNIMTEVAAAYATIANKGVYQEPISFTRVLDRDGKEIINNSSQVKRYVFKESTTFILTDWMEDVVNKGTASRAKFEKKMHIAGKTGTNSNYRGIFFAGFTPYYTATVWIGHDDYGPTFKYGSTAGTYAAPLWRSFMEPIHRNLEDRPFYDSAPSDVVKATVCSISGKLPTDLCMKAGHVVEEWFPRDAVPEEYCDWHQELVLCKESGKLPGPYCPDDQKVGKAVIVLPEDSPYRQLSDADLKKYLPDAVKKFPNLQELDYHDPKDKEYFCPVHTNDWQASETERASLVQEVTSLVEEVTNNLNRAKNEGSISPENLEKLEDAISKLLGYFTEGETAFNADAIKDEMENLRRLNEELFESKYRFNFQ